MIAECSFHALDVETANSSSASICQIGIVHVTDGVVTDQWGTYVDPEEHFEPRNVKVHGIHDGMVCESPTYPQLHTELRQRLGGDIVVSHSSFDRGAMRKVAEKYGVEELNIVWLDSVWIARFAWPELPQYRLNYLAEMLDLKFRHHDAVEDARVAAEIVLAACNKTGRSVADWLTLRDAPQSRASPRIRQEGVSSAPVLSSVRRNALSSECVVFTGNSGVPRSELKVMTELADGHYEDSVTRRTTMLVVGDNRGRISSKQRKAAVLQGQGQPLKILTAAEFLAVLVDV